jgi:hypothetical protein
MKPLQLIGCERTGLNVLRVGVGAALVDVAIARWEAFTGEQAVRL